MPLGMPQGLEASDDVFLKVHIYKQRVIKYTDLESSPSFSTFWHLHYIVSTAISTVIPLLCKLFLDAQWETLLETLPCKQHHIPEEAELLQLPLDYMQTNTVIEVLKGAATPAIFRTSPWCSIEVTTVLCGLS